MLVVALPACRLLPTKQTQCACRPRGLLLSVRRHLPQGNAHKVFEDAARAIDEVEVYQTTSAEAAKAAGLSKEGLVVVKTFEGEEMSSVFPDAMSDKDAVRTFVKSEKVRWGFG